MAEKLNGKVLEALREATAPGQGFCVRCGIPVAFFNHLVPQYEDCNRCHMNGRLFDKGCRARGCPRCKTIVDGGWRETGWPR